MSLKIIIHQGAVSGTAVYQENHLVTSYNNGLVPLEIGTAQNVPVLLILSFGKMICILSKRKLILQVVRKVIPLIAYSLLLRAVNKSSNMSDDSNIKEFTTDKINT